jgi:hypothetical protein
MMKSPGSTSCAAVHAHCAASSKMMSRLMWTRRVMGSYTRYALDPGSYPTKIMRRLRSSSFFKFGVVTLTWATHPNVRR